MAKQLIADQLNVLLPQWDGEKGMANPPVLADRLGAPVSGRRVDFPGRHAALLMAEVEVPRGDYVPDVTAQDEEGLILIEIRVSHAVDELKRRRIQSEGIRLIEIDLSSLGVEQALDEEGFARSVLDDSRNRVWLCCPAATDQWRASLRDLKMELATRNLQILEAEELAKAAERAKAEAAAALASNREIFRIQCRARYEASLRALSKMVSAETRSSTLAMLAERDASRVAELVGNVASGAARGVLLEFHPDAWIYQVHPCVWQAEVFATFVSGKPAGHRFNQREVAQWMRARYRWHPELYDLFIAQYAARSAARKRGFAKQTISAWFFTAEENKQIPNFYRPINSFVERLARAGVVRFGETLGEVEVV